MAESIVIVSGAAVTQDVQDEAAPVVFVLDGSDHMWGAYGGEVKIPIVKSAVKSLLDNLRSGGSVGLVSYGFSPIVFIKLNQTGPQEGVSDRLSRCAILQR